MYDHYKEATWPDEYRRSALGPILTTLTLQRSLRVAGWSGMGKSNLLRFLVSHPHLLVEWPDFSGQAACFLYIDSNRLHPLTPLTFYRECLFLLRAEQGPPPAEDAYTLYKQVELALRAIDPATVVILVIDQAERLYDAVEPYFFDQLRSLRDEARRGHMLFIMGSRRPVGDLFQLEKLFVKTCWVGPLAEADRAAFLARHQQRLNVSLPEKWQQALWQVTGGHPGLLKNSLEWAKGQATLPATEADWLARLLAYAPIERYCRQLWQGLGEGEQHQLRQGSLTPDEAGAAAMLADSGLLLTEAGAGRLFSPLWEAYLRRTVWPAERPAPLEIDLDVATRRVTLRWAGQVAETLVTRPLVFELLRVLAADPGSLHSKDALIAALYPEEKAADVFDDALFQLITGLRKAIDPPVKQLCPALTDDSVVQSIRGVGYRLVVELPE